MKNVVRYNPDIKSGLNKRQIEKRIEEGLSNYDVNVKTKSITQIVLLNIFTLFNILNFFLALIVALVGSYKNLLFMGGVICNTLISIIQEVRTKKAIDELSLLATSKVKVIRDGKCSNIDINKIVLDDIILFKVGDQIPVDTKVLCGKCEVNEAFITGEEVPILKKEGDMLLSGSFIVSGYITGIVEHVGEENYTSKISKEAKYIKKVNSVLMKSLNTIIKWVSIVVIPLGFILFFKQMYLGNDLRYAVLNTVAAVIGMIPEGLVLLTSTVLAVGILKLSKYKVLVQELYCIEMLARTDVLCLDKTGTLTEGKLEVSDLIPLKSTVPKIERILGNFADYMEDGNATLLAIRKKYKVKEKIPIQKIVPFTSERKYSALITYNEGTYLLGAPEFLIDNKSSMEKDVELYSKQYRVLALTHIKDSLEHNVKKGTLLALILMQDVVRDKAKQTISYFKNQGVNIKIISGDHPLTVSHIAYRVGIENYQKYIDMSTIEDKDITPTLVENYTIFGRVTPGQKKAIILALKERGHTVAMTGDGVNDVLALKEADCSIAMKSGSDAARCVSQIILLESNFDAMPKIVTEGRQTINNIERSASLFLTKTMYASMLAIVFLFIHKAYPFEPIQLTLTSVVAIGIPSFVLALEPNQNRIAGTFFSNVISKSLPFSFMIVMNIIMIMIFSSIFHFTKMQTSTLCVIMNTVVSFFLLFQVSLPFNKIKRVLFISMVILFLFQIFYFRTLFSLSYFNLQMILIIIALNILNFVLIMKFIPLTRKMIDKRITNKKGHENN